MFHRTVAAILAASLAIPPHAAYSQTTPKFELTIDNIMRGPGLFGWTPRAVRWSADSQRVFFQWKLHDEALNKEYSTYVVNRDGSGMRKLSEEEEKQAPPVGGSEDTRDWKLTVYSDDGDLYLYDQMAGRRHRLTKTGDSESNPQFTQDEKRIVFVRNNNLFVLTPGDGAIEQLTDIQRAGGGGGAAAAAPAVVTGRRGGRLTSLDAPPRQDAEDAEKKGTESQEFLKKEERDLLQIVKERAAKREEDEAKKKKANPRKPFRLTARQSASSLLLSPDETYVVATVRETSERTKSTIVPNYITDAAYTADIPARSKVGDEQSQLKLAILNVATGESKWVDHGIKDRQIRFDRPRWSEDGTKLAVMARASDNKDAWIMALDPKDGKCRQLATMHDDAWVDGPAAFTYGWLKDNKRIYYTAEKDGWSHLFTVDFESGEQKQLTSGNWEVRDVVLSPDRTKFYLTTSEVHPGEEHLYEMSVDGGVRKRLTTMPGAHRALVSPDGTMIASIHSYTNKPPELYLLGTAGKSVQVTHSPAPDFASYAWTDVPIVQIPARDGVNVPARMYKPKNYRRGGPLVVFVHGAGYLQNVHRYWSSYAREYMFHHLLMERGYLVLDVDYRGSAGYGRDWRTAIYRFMGGKDLDDQVDAVKWAVKEHGVDPKRVGLYGGSYGGFITLMALFTQPDFFQAGAALRPVTDWAHYNHGYTANILNTPQKDAEAYRRSSPIYHAQNLKGALLICHGMVDVNVHFQDTVRLVQRLIELRKENWELAVFPVEDHGFVQPTSWADEYKRILKLFETNLRKM